MTPAPSRPRRGWPAFAGAALALGACGERAAPDGNRAAPDLVRPPTAAISAATPVRVGEAGPAFRACQAAGTPRGAEPLPVRPGPFEAAPVTGGIAPDARFFVCTRSIDQKWMGIVFDPAGALSPACGVSAPAPARAEYAGPCRSGWVGSAGVRLVAG